MITIEQLIDSYVDRYDLLGKESRKVVLKRVLNEIDRICFEEEFEWHYFLTYSSRTGSDGIFNIGLQGKYSENREYCQLKCFEEMAKKIKEKYRVNDDELLELFESSLNINRDNYKERFGFYTEKFTVNPILRSEVGRLMKLFCIKDFENSTQKYSNPYWKTLFEELMSFKYLRISNLELSDEFKEKYLPEYYKKIDNESFLRGEDDIELLLKYIDNPTIKGYLYTIKEQLSEEQFKSLMEKTKPSEMHMVFKGEEQKDDYYHEILHEKIKDLYPDDIALEIINLLIKLPTKYKERLSAIIEDKNATIEILKDIKILSAVLGNNIEHSFKIASFYPELMKSIDSVETLNEKNVEMLNKLSEIPKLSINPKSFDELEEILSNSVISTAERNDDRFQPDDSELGGRIIGFRSIIVIDENGKTAELNNYDHYTLVSHMYGIPKKEDYFFDLVEKSNEGYITIITEGSSAFVYFPKNISKKQMKTFEEILDKYKISDSNFDFYMIQSLDAKEENKEKYRLFEGKDKDLTRTDAMNILENSIREDEREGDSGEEKIEDELDL